MKTSESKNLRSDKANLPQYGMVNAAKNDMTVKEWKDRRFSKQYPGLTVDVLDGDGNHVPGQTKIGTVRESYAENDD
ncbi:hypothetical protein [Desulfovibrio cuneatus]|uniref:hypothetical protein n=1 Tax=Desulfovibrio cuneatus TaxID=159728 RepID=UPI000A075C51|nr:hypothetical protein [Desulfovibrio cuneatus]